MAINEKISAGAVAANAQVARDPGAVTQNPTVTVTSTGQRLAEAGITTGDTGTNPPTVPLSQSQATPSRSNRSAPRQAGVGARGDDGVTVTGNTTKDMINQTFLTSTDTHITPRNNVLDDYASYTYQISWYLLSELQFNALVNSPQRSEGTWSLLMQSGGISQTSPAKNNINPVNNTLFPGRSQFFPDDFYLDDLEIHSLFPLGGMHLAHSAASIKFKVVEPNGLTLIDNLYNAVNDLYAGTTDYEPATNLYYSPGQAPVPIKNQVRDYTPNYIQAHYCLTIKFYGYDIDGNLQRPIRGKNNSNNKINDVGSIVSKIYPFTLKDITFTMAPGASSKGIEYHIEGLPTGHAAGFGQSRGTIPFNFELSGTTVGDLLIGQTARSGPTVGQEGRVPQPTPPGTNIPAEPAP